jgi:hypothetical protein
VPTNLTQARFQEFVTALRENGGTCGNVSLRRLLGWEDEEFIGGFRSVSSQRDEFLRAEEREGRSD